MPFPMDSSELTYSTDQVATGTAGDDTSPIVVYIDNTQGNDAYHILY
jgi:hypothetical protein